MLRLFHQLLSITSLSTFQRQTTLAKFFSLANEEYHHFPAASRMLSYQHHCVVSVGNTAYHMRNRIEKTIDLPTQVEDIIPAVVFNLDGLHVELEALQSVFDRFESIDDVFSRDFTTGSILHAQIPSDNQKPSPQPNVSKAVQDFLHKNSCQLVFGTTSKSEAALPEGPYFVHKGGLHQAWRLYEDHLFSMVTPVVPAEDGDKHEYQPLHAGAYTGMCPVVAVPSRLYSPPTKDRPLNGKRISIKDNYHLSGIVTTIGSRAFAEFHGVQNTTSKFVQGLIDQGAVIVGKSKMSGYALSEVPPEKCIDYFPPWNPRGDRYQGPSGSSSGAGSSAAGYEWLDLAIGTDTTGSIRMPAASYGLWGMKATQQSFSVDDLVASVPRFDAIGILARKSSQILDLYRATGFWKHADKTPTRLIYPTDFYPMPNEAQQKMQDEFAHALEDWLGFKCTRLSLSDLWEKTRPEHVGNKSLTKYMEKSGEWINFYDGYHIFDDFRKNYQKKFGRKPYASPWVTSRWQIGIDITKEQREQAVVESDTVAKWLSEHIFTADDDGNGGTIMLMPFGRPLANYRDTPGPPKDYPDTSYNPLYLPSVLGYPQAVVPIGQNPYESRVSGNIEYAPITGSLIGARGADAMLLRVAQAALDHAGWPSKVSTGSNIFEVGDNSRHSAAEKCYLN